MSIEMLHRLSGITLILSAVFLVIAAALFFGLHLKDTIGYLTGSERKKAIDQIAEQSKSGVSRLQMSKNRGIHSRPASDSVAVNTTKLNTEELITESKPTTLLKNEAERNTTLLDISSQQTTLLKEDELPQEIPAATADYETTVLKSDELFDGFRIDFEIGFSESLDIIQ